MKFMRFATLSAIAAAMATAPIGLSGGLSGQGFDFVAAIALEQDEVPSPPLSGFLGSQNSPDFRTFLTPPPQDNSALSIADVEIFGQTRSLEGSERWRMAQQDIEVSYEAQLEIFSCALDAQFDAEETPILSRLMSRTMADLGPMIGGSKSTYQRARPFLSYEGPICSMTTSEHAATDSYPSGHAALGWFYALVLAEVEPSRAAQILARGRAYGESRAVCGVHYVSDIEGGRMLATGLVAALNGNAEFLSEVAAARRELEALRAHPRSLDASQCERESELIQSPW